MIVIDKWAGLVTNASPYTLPPGAAATQVNLQVLSPGRLTVRPGFAGVTFSSVTATSSPIRAAFRHPAATETLVYQTADGVVRVAKGPA